MYFCTGEGFFNGDAIRGLGVWKSTNGGNTWSQLASTNNSNFYYCQRIAITSAGVVLVATQSGLQRSADGGTSWTKVLGMGLGITGAGSNICYDVKIAANGDIYSSLLGSIHKSTNNGVTFAAAQTLPITAQRIELACAPSDANYIYAVCENSSVVEGVLRSTNGGSSWSLRAEPDDLDPGIPNTDFSRGQAWYDLCMAVDPNNQDVVLIGGIDLFKSTDGAGTWTQISHWYGGFGEPDVHADQHMILYKNGSSTEAYFLNDGGIYRTTTAGNLQPTIANKGTNYVSAQFYSCAMHPTAVTNHFLAGAQDNGSHKFTSGGLQNTVEVTGGDGAFCHIDQDEPQYQFTSYVFNEFYRSADGGSTWTNIATGGGSFISPTDYDDVNDKLYMANSSSNYRRWDDPQTGSSFVVVAAGFSGMVSAVKVSPNTANRVFFGMEDPSGDVYRVDNANTGTPTVTNISTGLPGGYVSCIEVETGNDNHLLVTYSNFGINNVWESTNGGTSWTNIDGNLPDMPVRWALFNPNNNDQCIIATELGVWSTDNINGGTTNWGATNSGLANVRVDMLQLRTSDKLVIAATHGRGLFYSDIFADPTALFEADKKVTYMNANIQFTSNSYKASSWSWDFGDATSSTAENPVKAYTSPGRYTVILTINSGASSITKTQYIHVLPNKGTPYTIANGGGFEVNSDDFGVDHVAGTSWERGNSAIVGKNGTHAGSFAWVTGLSAANYADNSESILMTPNYNFNTAGVYTLSFWARYNCEGDWDGFRVEYTLDRGTTWTALGTTVAANWYNSANTSGTSIFPANEAFFSGNVGGAYTNYFRDLSFLAGNGSVGFRFRFKTDEAVTVVGAAIDDVQITGPLNYILPLSLTSFRASKQNADAFLLWNTENENDLSRFVIERSWDGNRFSDVGTVNARNLPQDSYQFTDYLSQLPVRPTGFVYYRLRMIDRNGQFRYSAVARLPLEAGSLVRVGPNPFRDFIQVYSADAIRKISFYDLSGREVFSSNRIIGNRLDIPQHLPAGIYLVKAETSGGSQQFKMEKVR